MKPVQLLNETPITETLKRITTYHFLQSATRCPFGMALIYDSLGDQLLLLPLEQEESDTIVAYILPSYVTLLEGVPFDVQMVSKTYTLHVYLAPVEAFYQPGAPEGVKNGYGEPIARTLSPTLLLTSLN